MSRMNGRKSRIAGLLALALGAVALLALSGVATAQDRGGDDNGNHGHHGHHGRHHHHHFREVEEAGTISSFDPATGNGATDALVLATYARFRAFLDTWRTPAGQSAA